jgi:dodecin
MADSVYKVIELIGTSTESWEKAAAAAVSRAGESLRDLRVAEVVKLDLQLDASGKVEGRVGKAQACPPSFRSWQWWSRRMRLCQPYALRSVDGWGTLRFAHPTRCASCRRYDPSNLNETFSLAR